MFVDPVATHDVHQSGRKVDVVSHLECYFGVRVALVLRLIEVGRSSGRDRYSETVCCPTGLRFRQGTPDLRTGWFHCLVLRFPILIQNPLLKRNDHSGLTGFLVIICHGAKLSVSYLAVAAAAIPGCVGTESVVLIL